MKRNPVMPYVVIMVIGVLAMFLISFKGINDSKLLAEEIENGGKEEQTEQVAASDPESIYQQNCVACHGDQYQGGVGPALTGVGGRLSADEIKNILVNGKGSMPGGLVPDDKVDEVTDWLTGL